VIAQPVAVDLEALVADRQRPRHVHVLLVVGGAELLLGGPVLLLRDLLLAVHGADGVVEQVEGDLLDRVLAEGAARVGHLAGLLQLDRGALVGGPQLLGRLDDLEAQPPGVEGVVVLDLGALEHEHHPAVREVQADGHLGLALVGAVPHAEPAAERLAGVEEVEVHALVEVRLGSELVRVVVLGDDVAGDPGHGALLGCV
jgi:hypothetical protein